MLGPVDWSSTTMTGFFAEGRTLTCAFAMTPPLGLLRAKSLRPTPPPVQQGFPLGDTLSQSFWSRKRDSNSHDLAIGGFYVRCLYRFRHSRPRVPGAR